MGGRWGEKKIGEIIICAKQRGWGGKTGFGTERAGKKN